MLPVLVGGATMPAPSELPDDLVPLVWRHAIKIRDTLFQQDVDLLIESIEKSLKAPHRQSFIEALRRNKTAASVMSPRRSRVARLAIGAALMTGGLVVAGSFLWLLQDSIGSQLRPTSYILPSSPEALFARGKDYFFGRGVPQDYAEAARWYHEAAERGYPSAQNSLARMYEAGRGVVYNMSEALKWYQKAAAQRHPDAQEALKRFGAAPAPQK